MKGYDSLRTEHNTTREQVFLLAGFMSDVVIKQQPKLEPLRIAPSAALIPVDKQPLAHAPQNDSLRFPISDKNPLLNPQQTSQQLKQHVSLALNCLTDRQVTELLRTSVRWDTNTSHNQASHGQPALSFEQGYEVVRNLTDTKIARFFGNMIAREPEAVKQMFSRLAHESPMRAANILLATKEPPNPPCSVSPLEGALASALLQSCGQLRRGSVAIELKKSDPVFYDHIINRPALLSKISKAPGTFVTSETLPQPSAPVDRPVVPTQEGAREVLLGEYCVATAKKAPALTTSDISLCVAVTFYDRQTQLGVLGHITPNTSVSESFDRMIGELRSHGVNPQAVEVKLIGGRQQGSEVFLYEIERRLLLEKMNIVERDVLQARTQPPLHISLDLNTGVIGNIASASPEATSGQAAAWTQYLHSRGAQALSPHPESIVGSVPLSHSTRQILTSAK